MTDDVKTNHVCPAKSCRRSCPYEHLACSTHWSKVSTQTRREVWKTWREGDAAGHLIAMTKAIEEMNAA